MTGRRAGSARAPGCAGGVWADDDVTIGPHSEIKASLIFAGSAAAHHRYVACDSIIGQDANLAAGEAWPAISTSVPASRSSSCWPGKRSPPAWQNLAWCWGDGTQVGASAVASPRDPAAAWQRGTAPWLGRPDVRSAGEIARPAAAPGPRAPGFRPV